MKYYGIDGDLIRKNELLDRWYKELVRWLKRQLKCVTISMGGRVVKEYVSKSLVSLVEDGYHLMG